MQKHGMKKHGIWLAVLLVLLAACPALAAELKFSWLPNTEKDLAGYRIYYGSASRKYAGFVDMGMPAVVAGKIVVKAEIPYGNGFFAATAYNAAGFESDFSNEATGNIPPLAPGGFVAETVTITYKIAVPK